MAAFDLAEITARPDFMLWHGPLPRHDIADQRGPHAVVPEQALLTDERDPTRAVVLVLIDVPGGAVLRQEPVRVTDRQDHGARYVVSESGRLTCGTRVCVMGVR